MGPRGRAGGAGARTNSLRRETARNRGPSQAVRQAPARRGSPPPVPSGATAWTPPKYRFRSDQRLSGPRASRAATDSAGKPGSTWKASPSQWIRGRLDRGRRVQAEVDHGADGLQDGGADPGRATAAQDQLDPAGAEDDGRRHHRRHPDARGRGVEAVGVEVVLPQHVVQHHARAGHDVARCLAVGGRQRGHVALGVGHAGVGRAPGELRPVRPGPGGLEVLEGPPEGDEVRRLAPTPGRRHLGGQEPEAAPDQPAPERRRRVGQHRAVPVPHRERLSFRHGVRGEVLRGDQAVTGRHVGHDLFAPARRPQVVGRVGLQLGQEASGVGVREAVSRRLGIPVEAEQAPPVLGQAQDRPEQVGHRTVELVEHDALVGQLDGRGEHVGQGQAPQPLVDGQVAGHRPRHGRRPRAGVEDLVDAGIAQGHREEVGLGHRVEAPTRACPRRSRRAWPHLSPSA